MSYRLFTPEQRGHMLGLLKKGPAFGDREKLAEYTQDVYKVVTGRNLTADCDKIMKDWRAKNCGKCRENETFVW